MKKLLALLLLSLCNYSAISQPYLNSAPDSSPKPSFTHIIIYRTWGSRMVYNGGTASVVSSWQIQTNQFGSVKDLMSWINGSNGGGFYLGSGRQDVDVAVSENEIIGIYDLTTAKQIKLKLNVAEKSLPKRVEIQAEKWTEKSYTIED